MNKNITKEKIIIPTSSRILAKGGKETKTEFVSILFAHHLQSALAAVKWSLNMLLSGDFGKINKEQKNIIKKTIERNEELISLVNNFLDTAKNKEKKYFYNKNLTDIKDIIESVIYFFQEEIKKKKIKFEFKKPKEKLPQIIVDKEKIKIAIQNIFDNAIKYTPPGGKISFFLKDNKKEIEFKIQDSGMGIPENEKEKLFTKFFRGVNAVKTETVGSGLGLFLAKKIIEAHNGKIWFESKENEGSSFYFSLPVKQVDPHLLKIE